MSELENKNKAKFNFDPNTAKPIDTPLVAKVDGFNFDPSTAKEDQKGVLGHLKDTATSFVGGVAGAAEDVTVGIADIYTEGRVGKDIDNTGYYKLGEAKKYWEDKKSDIAKEQEKTRQNIDGVWNKTKYVLENPSQISNAVVGSLPYMALGMGIGRASKIANPIVAGAVGEGAVMAGSQAESIRQQSNDQLLNNGQEAVAAGTGVIGGALGAFGGWVANKVFKVADIDTALQTGRLTREQIGEAASKLKARDIPLPVAKGAFSEGFLEELPQSVSEQILQNLALDKPWSEGVEDAAVMGTLAGMAMGGTASGVGKTGDWWNSKKFEYQQKILKNQQEQSDIEQQKLQDKLAADEAALQSILADQKIQSSVEQQRVWGKEDQQAAQHRWEENQQRSQQAQQEAWNHEDIQSNHRFLEQSTEQMGNLGNQIGNNNDPDDFNGSEPINPDHPNTPPAPNGQYFDAPQLASEKMGLNPSDGPMSSAAALAVDSGVTPMLSAPQDSVQNEDPLSSAIPSNYQSLLGSNNENFTSSINGLDQLAQLGERNAINDATSNQGANLGGSSANDGATQTTEGTGSNTGISALGVNKTTSAARGQSNSHNLNTVGNGSFLSSENEAEATSSSTIGTDASDSKSRTVEPILGDDGQNKWFGNQEKAQAFIDKKKLGKDYQVVQDGKRFEIQPNVAQGQDENQSQLEALEQQFVEAKTVPEKARIRKEINALQQSVIENTISASENNISTPKNTILDAQNHIDKSQANIFTDQISQLEQQLSEAKTVPEKVKLRKQINQLKSQQAEIDTTPQHVSLSPQQIQKQYGDTPESVMSDLEILGDDFTIDLRDDNKKTNALNNPNYNAVQKADGSVEIVGMKHPSTGEWVGKKPNAIRIDENAHQAATSSQNNTPEPTQAQIEAGNYKKGHIKVQGLDISIENPKGSERRGTDPNGKEWAHTMSDHYGYIKRTKGADNEHIDTYIGNYPDSNQVFIVDQIDQASGNFDEHKVMLGFNNQEEATTAYKSNFDKGWKVGPIRSMDMEQFKDWLKNGDTSKPSSPQNLKDSAENIRAEKIRQKDLADMHNSVFGLASDKQLQEALQRLDKEIAKAQKQSENEVVNGKRSTRKAVAAGALDRFLKNRVDLETYIKARKNGELKQRNNGTNDYSRKKLKPDEDRKGASPLDTTFTPLSVVSATRRVLSILEHLKIVTTQVDASVPGRIVVGWQRIGVNKVKGLDSHSFTVQVVDSFDGLPSAIQEDNHYQGENGETKRYDVLGVWHNGTLYINAGDIQGNNSTQQTTFEMYEELILHEVVGHFGVQQIFGREYKTKLQQLFNALGGLEGIRKIAKDNGVDMQQFNDVYINPRMQAVKDEIYTESDVQQSLVGELFAFVAQSAKSKPFVRQKLKEVLGYIRQWFRERGFDKFLSRYNDADLMMFLAEARKAVVDQKYFGKYKNQEFSSKNNTDTPLYRRKKSDKVHEKVIIQSASDLGQTHSIPAVLLNSSHRLGDVVDGLASMSSDIETDRQYSEELLRKIARLNPDIEVVFTNDPQLASGLSEGGHYPLSKNGREKVIIYPQGNWESDILSLVNHELVHAVTHQAIAQGKVNHELSQLDNLQKRLESFYEQNYKKFSDLSQDRLNYGFSDINEFIAVITAETEIRNELNGLLNNESNQQGKSTQELQGTPIGQVQQTEQGATGAATNNTSAINERSNNERSTRGSRSDVGTHTQQGFIQQFDHIVQRIIAARQKLFKGGQNKQQKQDQSASPKNDTDTPLYSRRTKNNTGSTVQQVRDVLVDRFGKDTINELERQGKLEIIQDYQVEGVEGFYHNGKAVLVASNLTAESAVPTFLHELGGHAGFQNMMNQQQYRALMNQFNKLVEQGNPVAMAAKMLAEREQGAERQQLEYLPYLLTLSSTMQQRNVLQRNALQQLISNIVSYVKAWAFDHFGVNLNLNPDDMLALSERMIQKSSVAPQGHAQENPSTVFSEKAKAVFTDAFTVAKDEQQRIAKDIDRLIGSLQSYPQPVQMKMPPVLLALNGIREGLNIQDLPLELDRFTLRKMTGQVDGKKDVSHQLSLDQIKQLPNELADPVAVLESDDGRNLTIITTLQDPSGNPVISAIHLNKKKGKYEINELATTFGRERFNTWLNKRHDKIVYVNNKKSPANSTLPHFLGLLETTHVGVVDHKASSKSQDSVRQSPLQLQGVVHKDSASNQSVLSPDDVVNFYTQANPPLYSRSAKDFIDQLGKSLSDISVNSIKDKTGYKFTDWLGMGLSALGRRQLTEIYSKLLPQLNKYNELAAQMDADKNDAGAEADTIVREWANLKDENELANLMHDATLAKIDPAQPYVPGDNRIKYQQLRQDFNALSPEAQDMYIKARDAYRKHYAKVQSAIKDRILRAALSSQKKADLIKQMDDQFYGYIKGVYFPLARFGKYVVVSRNAAGQVESVSRAETMGEAQKIRSEMLKKFPQWKIEPVIQDKEFRSARDAVGRGFMSSLFDEVAHLGLSSAEQASFEDTLNQLYLSSMPDLSWAKHGIHRKGTAGFSQDARRAFAQNMFSGANYLAKLRYGDQLADQLDAMQKHADDQIKQNHQYNQSAAQSVIDEMNKRHENLMNPKGHPLSSALTSLGFIYYLGLSPAAAMVNLSQTALVAYPIMGAKWGFDKAGKELLKASNDFRKGLEFHKVKWQGTKTDLYKAVSADTSKFLNKDEQQAYEDAVARGVIDVTQAHDLAGIAQGEDSGIMWKTRPIMRAASVMFHSAERFNREVTFIAAYRLARQAGAKHDSAFDQAVDATYRGHFDYSSGNRPRIMQGNVAKVLLLFKQFGQNMLYTLTRQTYQSIKGETKAERNEARKSLAAILAMHATFAGALGLPLVGMLLAVASWVGGDDDEPWDAEIALRNYLAEAFNPTISNLLMKGAPRALTPVDMSGRVGINNLLLPDVQEGLEGQRWGEPFATKALGPVAGIGLNLAKGTQEISEGHHLRGVETMLPVFLKNFAKTYRYSDEGVQDKTGISIIDEVDSMDLLVQGMGFSPSDVRTSNEGKSAIYQFNRKLNERRSRLMTLWSRAKMMDDQQEMDEIWQEIQGFNDKNPSRRITRMNLNQSYRNRQRRIDRAEDGIYLSRNRQDAREAGYFAFGE